MNNSGEAWRQLAQLGRALPSASDTALAQQRWLQACLQRNRATEYGRRYGFAQIDTVEDYRLRVPLVGYEDMEPWMKRLADGEPQLLFDGPAVAFERTSGSTGGAKLIAYSAVSIEDFRRALLPWFSDVASQYRLKGSAYWAISPATRQPEQTAGGIAVGLPDGAYLGEAALAPFAQTCAVPPWVGTIPEIAQWRLATLYFLVCRADLELVSIWSFIFFLSLLDALRQHHADIEKLLCQGGDCQGHALPADQAALTRLRAYLQDDDARWLWLDLKLVGCWADVSSKPFFKALRERLPHAQFQAKGLLCTEGVVTVPDQAGRPVLAVDSGFYEFLDDADRVYLAHELKRGAQYRVVMTTAGGLYRYCSGDRVVCESHNDGLPVLRFIGRDAMHSDLVGEKLTEPFVADCLARISGTAMLAPRRGAKPGYVLLIDARTAAQAKTWRNTLEQFLARNPQYAYARHMGQLRPLSVRAVPDLMHAYTTHAMQRGARLGDVKVPALCTNTHWLESLPESGK